MACSGEGQECKDADDVGSTQNCKSDETWCRKEETESPNGYFRSCTSNYFLMSVDKKTNVDEIMDKNGFKIQTLCVDVVIKALFSFLSFSFNLQFKMT